jgi:5-methylcytosine-specific restriction enzyme subunit McrC
MKIPVLNVYYLLCYAWDALEEGRQVDVAAEPFKWLPDLFARVLTTGTTRLLKRGLDQGYLPVASDTRSLRGKLDLTETAKRNLLTRSTVRCHYDEQSHDVLHNQILKSSLGRLARCVDLDRDLKSQALGIYRRLHDIREIELTPGVFDRVVIHRNNRFYGFLVEICRILHNSLLVDPRGDRSTFRDFLRDERLMAKVFEKFVRNFYLREQRVFKVRSKRIEWQDVQAEPAHLAYLPVMRTDVSLDSPARRVVIDTKYYASTLQTYHQGGTVHSQNLYQLFTYLRNLAPATDSGRPIEGILLYPTVDTTLDLRFTIHGHPVRVATVDLNAPWTAIRTRLLDLIRP